MLPENANVLTCYLIHTEKSRIAGGISGGAFVLVLIITIIVIPFLCCYLRRKSKIIQ